MLANVPPSWSSYLPAPPDGPAGPENINAAPLTCADINECAVGGHRGICKPDMNYTRDCCSKFSGCVNFGGGFECAPCMQGFIGVAYGAGKCRHLQGFTTTRPS